MSTEQATASPGIDTNNPMFGMFAEALKGYMQGMQNSQREFESDWHQHTSELNGVMSDATKNIGRRNKPAPLSPEIQTIVGALQSFPLLVPVVRQLVDQYMADVAAAYASVNDKYTVKTTNGQVPNNQPAASG